tara:strand:+ start:129 stop:260 length:132 start_codon:yes stop_codon:yes gene_type:complete
MKIKEDIVAKWESGWTVSDIAKAYGTTPEHVINILGLSDVGEL